MLGEEDDIAGGQHLCLDIASCKGERLRDGGEEGAEGKGSREIKDPPGIGGSGPGEGGKRPCFGHKYASQQSEAGETGAQ